MVLRRASNLREKVKNRQGQERWLVEEEETQLIARLSKHQMSMFWQSRQRLMVACGFDPLQRQYDKISHLHNNVQCLTLLLYNVEKMFRCTSKFSGLVRYLTRDYCWEAMVQRNHTEPEITVWFVTIAMILAGGAQTLIWSYDSALKMFLQSPCPKYAR